MIEGIIILAAVVLCLVVFVERNGGCLNVLGGMFVMMLWVIICGGLLITKETREATYSPPTQEKVVIDTGMFVNGC